MKNIVAMLYLSLVSLAAFAGGPPNGGGSSIPEPSTLALFAATIVAVIVARKFTK